MPKCPVCKDDKNVKIYNVPLGHGKVTEFACSTDWIIFSVDSAIGNVINYSVRDLIPEQKGRVLKFTR